MKRDSLLTLAATMGMIAHERDINAPALDDGILSLMEGPPSQEHIDLLKAWWQGWTRARLAEPVEYTD